MPAASAAVDNLEGTTGCERRACSAEGRLPAIRWSKPRGLWPVTFVHTPGMLPDGTQARSQSMPAPPFPRPTRTCLRRQ